MKVWFVENVYSMHRQFGNCWVECRDPIDLLNCPSNMEIGLWWYQEEPTMDS